MDEMRVGLQENILVTQDLVKSYPAGDGGVLTVLDHVNYEFPKGKLIMIMGRSGSGKTTLMNILSTLDDATEGEVYFDGTPYSQMSTEEKEKMRRHRIGFVFQSVALIPVMTAYENIDFALRTAGYKGEDGASGTAAFGSGSTLYGAGGGGGAHSWANGNSACSGAGGSTGGGAGGVSTTGGGYANHGSNATANTGSGGGGASGGGCTSSFPTCGHGGSGGSGIVIIRNKR